jgi:hypothetical protein
MLLGRSQWEGYRIVADADTLFESAEVADGH